jgi:hypothetical protein
MQVGRRPPNNNPTITSRPGPQLVPWIPGPRHKEKSNVEDTLALATPHLRRPLPLLSHRKLVAFRIGVLWTDFCGQLSLP